MAEGKTIFDMAVAELLELRTLVRDELRREYKGKRPFRQEPVSPKEQLVEYDELTSEKKQWLLDQFGDEAVLPYFEQMEEIKRRYK